MSEINVTPLSFDAQERARLHEALDMALNMPDVHGLYINVTTFGVEDMQTVGLVLGQIDKIEIVEASMLACKNALEKMDAHQADLAREPRH